MESLVQSQLSEAKDIWYSGINSLSEINMTASITLIGDISHSHLQALSAWLESFAIDFQSERLTDDIDEVTVQRLSLVTPFESSKEEEIRLYLLELSDETGIDHVYQANQIDIRSAGVAVFDMDSTLIKAEVIDELAKELGIGDSIAKITAQSMRGEIDFRESFVKRLSLLEGLSGDVMDAVFQRIVHMTGIETLFKVLNHFHWHTAILSGGFTYFADRLAQQYSISEVHANELEIVDGKLTGKHLGDIVDAERKRKLLENIVASQNINWMQTIACGDGANDLLMLNRANLGVALHAKPLVRLKAPHPINNLGLNGVLYLLGMSSLDIRNIMECNDLNS